MTDGGTFLLGHFDKMYKLGSCGLQEIEYPGTRDSGYICGKVPGGALFCSGKDCYRYYDETESFETMPALDQEGFHINYVIQGSYCMTHTVWVIHNDCVKTKSSTVIGEILLLLMVK